MKLALFGGEPVRTTPFPAYVTVGAEEKEALGRVIDSGILSHYIGAWHEQFMGGTEVQALEREWAAYFGAKHAVAVNSATSGLICALGAAGVGPGDEVIVTPWSMCISATAPLFYGAIPVFADIEPDYFCLDPGSIEKAVTPKTKAIIPVDLFGQPYDAEPVNAIAARHGLTVIEDAAQAPGGSLNGTPAGRLGTMGVFSLNYHKHIHCGEGGVVVTGDDELAKRLRLIRNHAEAVVGGMGVSNLTNMLGFNFRMTELEASVARCQLRKLGELNAKRLRNVAWLEERLRDIPCLNMPRVRPGATHVYYIHVCKYDSGVAGVSAERFVEALNAELPNFRLREKEGAKFECSYVPPLYSLPIFQKRKAVGSSGWPFSLEPEREYSGALCPVCEALNNGGILMHEFMISSMEPEDMEDVVAAFRKVWNLRHDLAAG